MMKPVLKEMEFEMEFEMELEMELEMESKKLLLEMEFVLKSRCLQCPLQCLKLHPHMLKCDNLPDKSDIVSYCPLLQLLPRSSVMHQ